MKLKDLGYISTLEKFRLKENLAVIEVGRVVAEHRELYVESTLAPKKNKQKKMSKLIRKVIKQ